MKLEEALANLEATLKTYPHLEHESFGKSIRLVVNVGKRVIAWRNDNDEDLLWNVPGETEE